MAIKLQEDKEKLWDIVEHLETKDKLDLLRYLKGYLYTNKIFWEGVNAGIKYLAPAQIKKRVTKVLILPNRNSRFYSTKPEAKKALQRYLSTGKENENGLY